MHEKIDEQMDNLLKKVIVKPTWDSIIWFYSSNNDQLVAKKAKSKYYL
jgi:hypothetical protein